MSEKSISRDLYISRIIQACGYSAIIFVLMIFYFLISEGIPTLREVSAQSLFGKIWYPIEGYYGIWPLIAGSLLVTLGATLIAVPIGLATAIFIAEVAPRWLREILKPFVEILAGIPSVVLGFIGLMLMAHYLRVTLDLPTGLTAIAGSILLGFISVPTIVSVAEDALDAVPRSYRDASLALGVTKWQTIWNVTLPAARSGVLTAIMLGIGRTIGETMAVMMVTGNAPVIPNSFASFFAPIRTMTATIAAEMGEVATGSTHYHVLFFIGILLFIITFLVNVTAASVVFRQRKRVERILS